MSETKRDDLTVELSTVEEAPVEEKKVVYVGKIRECEKLNVREKPEANSKVLCKIDKKTEALVEKSESTRDYYKVYLSSGVCGYCMKKYMSVKKQEV